MTLLQSKTDSYQVIEQLGRGTFGKVLKACKKGTGELVAIKKVKNKPRSSHIIANEIKLLNLISQFDPDKSHLVRFFEHFYVQDTCFYVFELLQQNLHEYQKEIRFAPVPLRHIRTITTQVLEALCKLKELSIIHADLKPENIMLVDQARYPFRVKVIDFGSAITLRDLKNCKEPYIQTRFYRAPEILLGLPFCETLDMWSLGCIIAELHLGYPLYPGKNEYDQIRYICETQGLPGERLLREAGKALSFFKYKEDTQRTQWRIKTKEEYQTETKIKPAENRKYILMSLGQLASMHTTKACSPEYPETEVLAEHSDLKNMVALMKRMLSWDWKQRVKCTAALLYPFISLRHLNVTCKDTLYYQLSKQCQGAAMQREQTTSHSMPPTLIK